MSAGRGGDPPREALVEELRAVGLLALDRLDPLVDRMTAALSAPAGSAEPTAEYRCTTCPICAALADLPTGRAEALAHVARQAGSLLAALRVALTVDGAPASAAPPARPERVVQHITVERAPTC